MRNLIYGIAAFSLLCSCVGGKQGDTRSYTQIATGQVLCYNLAGEVIDSPTEGDALYGQDANYLKVQL